MYSKLTIKLDKKVLDGANKYATSNNLSLSFLVESYLKALLSENISNLKENFEVTPFVKSLKSGLKIPSEVDDKKDSGDYLLEKYK